MQQRALCLLVDGFEEIEAVTPVDLLRRAGMDVVTAALGGTRRVCGRCGVTIEADALLGEVEADSFDLLVIPGGPGVAVLRADGRPAALAARFNAAGKTVGAICAAPLVLHDAGVLAGRRFTAHFSTSSELPHSESAEEVVVDGTVITSRGAGTALAFGLALVAHLCGAERADEIARSVMK
jgi:4-methyl-5(b-hydroxyethyl)-thiazole monophosphate biosynthesis